MDIAMKVQYIFVTIGYLLIGISADENLECIKIDFNKINSVNQFEQCGGYEELIIKAYKDSPRVTPYNADSVNFLSNSQEGWSCFSTIETFTIEADTELSLAIFLQSVVVGDISQVVIDVLDLDDEHDAVYPIINPTPTTTFTWTPYNVKFGVDVPNAKITIRAFVTVAGNLAIQYMHILNPRIDEGSCEIDEPDTEEPATEEPTTEEPTTEDPTTDEPTTEEPPTEEPTTEEPTTEEPATEEPTTEEPTTEEPTTEEPTTEEPTTEEPTTEEPTTEEPTTEEPTTEEPTTEEPTTEEPTTEELTTEEPTSTTSLPTPPDPNDNTVWIITSFVFFLTTIALIVGFVYLIYLYKTALAVKTAMASAATIQSRPSILPRLTVATSSQGNQVIVGIENFKQS